MSNLETLLLGFIDTEEKEHFEPVIYDKGGWNIQNVKYWLDCSMPKEIGG